MTQPHTPLRQLVILSGKGGTGKTSLAAALIHLASQSSHGAVFADADVDTANLALVTEAKTIETQPFFGSLLAVIDPDLCSGCGQCEVVCRFDAVLPPEHSATRVYRISSLLCDGCAACVYACPEDAIAMVQQQDGEWYHSETPYGHQFHASLFPAAENTGKLVTTVKQHAKLFAEDHQLPLMIVDGPPGIGCPVISASAGAHLALLVAEPGVSGLHDLERIMQTLEHFEIPIQVCINKADSYPEGTEAIRALVEARGYALVGEIPFDIQVPQSMADGLPITRYSPQSPASIAIQTIWHNMENTLFDPEAAYENT